MARTTTIKGIRFEDHTPLASETPSSIGGIVFVSESSKRVHDEPRQQAMTWVERNAEALREKGIKRVEFDSHGGYSYRAKTSGRFVPISTMHALRLLKR